MAYVITDACIDTKDQSCVQECPVDCIQTAEGETQYYIDPDICIDCGACQPVCPVNAIYPADEIPPDQLAATANAPGSRRSHRSPPAAVPRHRSSCSPVSSSTASAPAKNTLCSQPRWSRRCRRLWSTAPPAPRYSGT